MAGCRGLRARGLRFRKGRYSGPVMCGLAADGGIELRPAIRGVRVQAALT